MFILRLDEEASASRGISVFFKTDGLNGYRSRPRNGLPGITDAAKQYTGMWLKTTADLEQLRQIVKTEWRTFLLRHEDFS